MGIKKYYVGFTIIVLFMLGALIFTLSQAASAKTDKKTDSAVDQIATKLEIYIAKNGSIPETLGKADINDVPSTVVYTKVSSSQYKICFDYKNASSGFDAGWTSLFFGGSFNTPYEQNDSKTDNTYFDSSVSYHHKKGQNCQDVKPTLYQGYNYPDYSSGSSYLGVPVKCDPNEEFPIKIFGTVKSVDLSLKTISVTSKASDITVGSGGSANMGATEELTYDSYTAFYDANCNVIKAENLVSGSKANFYTSTKSGSSALAEWVELAN